MHIKINYNAHHYILIKLFDNPTVKKWFEYFSNENYTYNHTVESTPPSQEIIDVFQQWSTIIHTLKQLETKGFNVDLNLPDRFDRQQTTLNKLHRFFTYNILWYKNKDTLLNPYDSNFKPDNISEDHWHQLLDTINQAVHQLEKTVDLTTHGISVSPSIHALEFIPAKNSDLRWLEFDDNDIKQNYEYFNYNYYRYLVMLDRSILGKSILQTFIDDDDLSADDCTGRLGSHGGFIIDANYRRQQVYQSQIFLDWVKTFNLDPASLPYEFPIGYVCRASFNVDEYAFGNELNLQYQNVVFIGSAGEI